MRHSKRAFLLIALFCASAAFAAPVVHVAPRNGVLRVAIIGDAGDGTAAVARGIARIHAERPLDGIILPGDNVYPCGVKSATDPHWAVLQPLFDLGIPMYPVLGNHDWCGDPDAEVAYHTRMPLWQFPSREYLLSGGIADFAMIDTTPYVRGATAPQIASLLASSKATWRVVVGHHTIVSSGYHGYLPRSEHRRMIALLEPMRAAHVDLYICGHDHHLELVDGRPRMLISGAASEPIAPLVLHPHTLFPANAREQGGFAVVELTATRMSVTFFDLGGKRLGEFGWTR